MTEDHRQIRREYTGEALQRADLDPDPHVQFSNWLDAALRDELTDATAMSLATVDQQGQPAVRIVLLKSHGEEGFVFFTDYGSHKGQEIAGNPRAEMLFYWREHTRQVRIRGELKKVSRSESVAYFSSRPQLSQVSAVASDQSREIADRVALEARVDALKDDPLECPQSWGGYILKAERFEFWQGRANRLHDRLVYSRDGESWRISRLMP